MEVLVDFECGVVLLWECVGVSVDYMVLEKVVCEGFVLLVVL